MLKTWRLSAFEPIEQYREEVRAKYHADISQELEMKRVEGLYPFEGKWRTLEEITELQKLMRQKDRTIFVDLIILFIIIICFLFVMNNLLLSLLYKQ
ncbi:MAG: hypothetical protein IT393_05850 [Nitrospirae bacterium]|nr:hypothetical protein [Nitrospirota bacterium]